MGEQSRAVAAIVGDASNEEGYLVQRILREALGSPHVDSRISRGPGRDTLLRLAQPELSARVRDIDDADAILVVGTDPLHSSPILDLRIRKAMRRNGAKLAVATDRPTTLDGGAEAVARYAPGGATAFLAELARSLRLGTRERSASGGGRRPPRAPSASWSSGASGSAARARTATAALLDVAAALDLAGKDGCGLLEVPELTNARGLREAGCLPDAGPGLRVRIDRPPGQTQHSRKSTEEIRAALESGELKTLLLFGVDPLRDFPDTEAWKRALAAADHLVVFSTFENATTAMADVVFPLETHAEKDGTVTHPDGRLQRVRPSAARPGDIRPNWGVLAELSLALGHDTGVASQPSAFAALTEAVPFYAGIDDAEIGGRGSPLAGPPRSFEARRRPTGDDAPVRSRSSRSRSVLPGEGEVLATPRERAGDRVARPRDLPRPVGRPNHRAESAAEVPAATAAGRAVAGRRRAPRPEQRRRGRGRRRTARASRAAGRRSGNGSSRASAS